MWRLESELWCHNKDSEQGEQPWDSALLGVDSLCVLGQVTSPLWTYGPPLKRVWTSFLLSLTFEDFKVFPESLMWSLRSECLGSNLGTTAS